MAVTTPVGFPNCVRKYYYIFNWFSYLIPPCGSCFIWLYDNDVIIGWLSSYCVFNWKLWNWCLQLQFYFRESHGKTNKDLLLYVDMFQHKRFSKSWFLMLGRNHKRCESWIVLMILSFNAWCTSSYWFMHIIGLRWDVLSHLHELLRMYILTDIKNHVTCDISFENMSWCKLKPRETRPWIV